MRQELCRPADVAGFEPARHEVGAAAFGQDLFDQCLVGLGGSRREGERDLAKTEFEQAVAAARLAVVVPLWRGAGENFDLPIVQPKATINRRYLRLDRAVIWQHDPRRATFNDGRCDRGTVNVSERLGCEDNGGILLAQGLQPLAQAPGEVSVIQRQPALIDNEKGRPAIEAAL